MRKNSVRKFIHAILDLLPLFVIPIFAIYSMNHEISGNSVNTSGYEVRNKYETNEVNEFTDIQVNKIYHMDYFYTMDGDLINGEQIILKVLHYSSAVLDANDGIIYDDLVNSGTYNATENNQLHIEFEQHYAYVYYTNLETYVGVEYDSHSFTFNDVDFVITSGLNAFIRILEDNYLPEDITSSNFEVLEYVYNDGIVLDDEDIMSQFVYVTYNTVDKYFNMGNVFNMTGVYDWFVVNIFGGNAPISLFIVWNVVLYEFVMDLLMLLYGLFMWFIDMIEKLMNKPLDSIK